MSFAFHIEQIFLGREKFRDLGEIFTRYRLCALEFWEENARFTIKISAKRIPLLSELHLVNLQ